MCVKNTGILAVNFADLDAPVVLGSLVLVGDHQDMLLIKNNTILIVASG